MTGGKHAHTHTTHAMMQTHTLLDTSSAVNTVKCLRWFVMYFFQRFN